MEDEIKTLAKKLYQSPDFCLQHSGHTTIAVYPASPGCDTSQCYEKNFDSEFEARQFLKYKALDYAKQIIEEEDWEA
mgnify:FL=1